MWRLGAIATKRCRFQDEQLGPTLMADDIIFVAAGEIYSLVLIRPRSYSLQ
jgi:hypothetical protein